MSGAAKGAVKVGARAPGFRLQDETQVWRSLEDFRGSRVVLFFFQKAGTPGCTVEACEFDALLPRFAADGVAVLGVSPDTWRKQARFKAAQGLGYPLLADTDSLVCQAYGVWQQKLFWGRHYMGVIRSTFVVGPDGHVEKEWRNVAHEGHAAVVHAWLRGEPEPVPVLEVGPTTRAKAPRARTAEAPSKALSKALSKARAKTSPKPRAKAQAAVTAPQAARKK